MALTDAKVEITLGDLKEITSKRDSLEVKVTELEATIDELRLSGGGASAKELSAAFAYAYEIARFAIANLDPLAVRGWPWQAVKALAALLPNLAGVAPDIRECAPDIAEFAAWAKEWEDAREAGTEQQKHAEETAQKSANLADIFMDDPAP